VHAAVGEKRKKGEHSEKAQNNPLEAFHNPILLYVILMLECMKSNADVVIRPSMDCHPRPDRGSKSNKLNLDSRLRENDNWK